MEFRKRFRADAFLPIPRFNPTKKEHCGGCAGIPELLAGQQLL